MQVKVLPDGRIFNFSVVLVSQHDMMPFFSELSGRKTREKIDF